MSCCDKEECRCEGECHCVQAPGFPCEGWQDEEE